MASKNRNSGFEIGQPYTREEISGKLGGCQLEPYLPRSRGKGVVAGCFRKEKKFNPDAPNVIFVGSSSGVRGSAETLHKQKTIIPVFIKRAVNRWEYIGYFQARSWLRGDKAVRRYQEKHNRSDFTSVLLLRPVSSKKTCRK
jgi:hypothetical protein